MTMVLFAVNKKKKGKKRKEKGKANQEAFSFLSVWFAGRVLRDALKTARANIILTILKPL